MHIYMHNVRSVNGKKNGKAGKGLKFKVQSYFTLIQPNLVTFMLVVLTMINSLNSHDFFQGNCH